MHTNFSRILLVRPDAVGDVMTASGIPAALKQHLPGVSIGFLVGRTGATLLQNHPYIDDLILDDALPFLALVTRIRRLQFDTAFLLMQSKRHAWATFLAGIPQRYGIGGKPYEILSGVRGLARAQRSERHQTGMDILARAGLFLQSVRPKIHITPHEQTAARMLLGLDRGDTERRFVFLQYAAKTSPNWPVETWNQLARALVDRGWHVVANTYGLAKSDAARVHLAGQMDRFTPLSNLGLRELAAVISLCRYAVAPNTGPLHMAAGLGIPAIGLFCRINTISPDAWQLPGEAALVPLNCRPCPGHGACSLIGITVEDVFAAIEGGQ